MNCYWPLILMLTMAASCLAEDSQQASSANSGDMVVRYYNRGPADDRHAYKFALLQEALDITRSEYGDYSIEPYRLEPSSKRQPLLMKEGDKLNVIWASPGTEHAQGDVIAIPIDILHGLMGYRVCLINSATHTNHLNNTKDLNDFRKLRIGQGAHWADIAVYKHNGITPIQSASFDGLFQMLSFNRFDCLPLGVTEAGLAYREERATYPSLEIEKNLLIFYEYPLYFYVSEKFPKLAERIHLGLNKLIRNGRFDSLFKEYFQADLAILSLEKRRLICLASPYSHTPGACHNPVTNFAKRQIHP